jgi:hypothetical protein
MDDKRITIASQDHIELYDATARRFFCEVLDMDSDECLLTDDSYLSDFSSCGMPDELAGNAVGLRDLYAAWNAWVLGALRSRYGLEYDTTAVPLLTLLRDLEEVWCKREQ